MNNEQIQQALLDRGYDIGPAGVDGDIGPASIVAITSFQKANGLKADGLAGPRTQAALLGKDEPGPKIAEPDQPPWLTLAAAEIGTVEGIGKNNNPKVIAYFRDAGFPGIKEDSVAWCAALVGAMLKRSGIEPSGSLAARSYERWGVGLKEPLLGCIATKRRGNSAWQGHVFVVVGANSTQVFGLGGNQADSCNISSFKKSEVTSYRWPKEVPVPMNTKLPSSISGAKASVKES